MERSAAAGPTGRATFECEIEASQDAEAVLARLDADGLVAADHVVRVGESLRLVLREDEIAVAEKEGLVVARGEPLAVRDERSDSAAGSPPEGAAALAPDDLPVERYLDAAQIDARMRQLASRSPSLCTYTPLPEPTSGYDGQASRLAGPARVWLLRITTTPDLRSKPGFLLVAGTHAREWMNPLAALTFARHVLAHYDPASTDPEFVAMTRLVSEGDVLIVAAMNPDGLNYSIHDDAGWRKNRNHNGPPGTCRGVDNNRNYEVYFGGDGSSNNPCMETYRGAGELSEPENRNIRWLLEQFPNVLVGVDAHSSGRKILRPSQRGGDNIPSEPMSDADDAIYVALENVLHDAIQEVNGVSYSRGTTQNHAGTSDEHMFFAHRVFGFNTECGQSFQPPWPEASDTIEELTAGLRALALATLDLDVTTPAPARAAQCIDRSSSMIAFAFEDPARANAKRFVDLMSLGDSVAIVSFAAPSATPGADEARVDLPLTSLDDPGDAATAHAAIDAMKFDGHTPIGAGLLAAAEQLSGKWPYRKAILLISDGLEDRSPAVQDVLPALAGLRVFAVALGTSGDTALLKSIASQTGGSYYVSPTALDLHQVYNQIRSDITEQGLVLNEAVAAADGERDTEHTALVEQSADRLVVTVSTPEDVPVTPSVRAPCGRRVLAGDFGVSVRCGGGYAVVEILRPAPGAWTVASGLSAAHVVAAFVDSPLHVDVRVSPGAGAEAPPVSAAARFGELELAAPGWTASSRAVAPAPLVESPGAAGPLDLGWDDRVTSPAPPAALLAQDTGTAPMRWSAGIAAVPGCDLQVSLRLEGTLSGGAPYTRVALRTVGVVDG